MKTPSSDLDLLYRAILASDVDRYQGVRLRDLPGSECLPRRGVYFFFEDGEFRADGVTPRIVRVGTHAISQGSRTTLWDRLRAHRGSRNGNGNHRGSIFRLHVGRALMARSGMNVSSWGQGASVPKHVRSDSSAFQAEANLEQLVSQAIGSMRVRWINVDDDPSSHSARAECERNAIALLSSEGAVSDRSSKDWLGRWSVEVGIQKSGLWNLNHVGGGYDRSFFRILGA